MRIFDILGNEIESPDLTLGKLVEENIFVAHHPEIYEVEEQWHYDVIAEYPNGGKDVKKVVDVPGVKPKDAWDEYETILRYVLYTAEELSEIEANRKPTYDERLSELEEAISLLLSGDTV